MKKAFLFPITLMTLLMIAAPAFAQEGVPAEAAHADGAAQVWLFISSAFGMAIVSSFAAIAMAISVKSFCEGVSRNPSAAGRLQTAFILTLVLIETLALYVLAVIFVKVAL
ncbi:MAG TPA: ATP synthase F0 subunit C [Acidobacteriota bacterium]|nr:ATP synthase F0 subunit C [Acidobacteriota bacterium]